jgi:signal peptidase I
MENNLLIGDHLLVNKFVYAPAGPEGRVLPMSTIRRGDVVVFKFPEDPSRDFIKRVIGLPGESLEVRDKKVYINGSALEEPYVHYLAPATGRTDLHEVTSSDVRENFGPVTVPADEFFMMGDNRDNSMDSRYWGFLKRDYVKGKALIIYWSYDGESASDRQAGIGSVVKDMASVVVHFFTRTRWTRMFSQIR